MEGTTLKRRTLTNGKTCFTWLCFVDWAKKSKYLMLGFQTRSPTNQSKSNRIKHTWQFFLAEQDTHHETVHVSIHNQSPFCKIHDNNTLRGIVLKTGDFSRNSIAVLPRFIQELFDWDELSLQLLQGSVVSCRLRFLLRHRLNLGGQVIATNNLQRCVRVTNN